MIIVSNTGPLIGLAKLDQLGLLNQIASDVYVPPQVQAELLAKTGPEYAHLVQAFHGAVKVAPPAALDPTSITTLRFLDEGERQAIALARCLPPPVLLLLDDRAGRSAARKLGQPLSGLGGFLLLAKKRGLIPMITPLLAQLRAKGYWVSDEVVNALKRLAGE